MNYKKNCGINKIYFEKHKKNDTMYNIKYRF